MQWPSKFRDSNKWYFVQMFVKCNEERRNAGPPLLRREKEEMGSTCNEINRRGAGVEQGRTH